MVRDAAQLPVIELKAQQQAWSDGLRGLSLLDEGLWQRACAWVRDGSGEAVLAELRACAPRACWGNRAVCTAAWSSCPMNPMRDSR